MWQSVVRPLLRITSTSKILFLFFLAPFFWKSAFEFLKTLQYFWLRGDTVWLSSRKLRHRENFLKLATMKVFHVKKAQNLLDGKCFLKLSKAYLKWKIGENGFEYIIAILAFVMCCFCFILIPTLFRNVRKVQVLAYFLCWIVGSLLINDLMI